MREAERSNPLTHSTLIADPLSLTFTPPLCFACFQFLFSRSSTCAVLLLGLRDGYLSLLLCFFSLVSLLFDIHYADGGTAFDVQCTACANDFRVLAIAY